MFKAIKNTIKETIENGCKKELYYQYCICNGLKINLNVTILDLSYLRELQLP